MNKKHYIIFRTTCISNADKCDFIASHGRKLQLDIKIILFISHVDRKFRICVKVNRYVKVWCKSKRVCDIPNLKFIQKRDMCVMSKFWILMKTSMYLQVYTLARLFSFVDTFLDEQVESSYPNIYEPGISWYLTFRNKPNLTTLYPLSRKSVICQHYTTESILRECLISESNISHRMIFFGDSNC